MSAKIRVPGPFALVCAMSFSACSDSGPVVDDPPGPIADLSATVSGGLVRLSWKEPDDGDVSGSLLARFPASGVDAQPEAGRTYAAGDPLGSGLAIFSGSATAATDSPPCKEHVYAAWARDAAGNWSADGPNARVGGLPGSPVPAAPLRFTAAVEGTGIALSWSPATAGSSVRFVRKRGSAPTGVTDGETVFVGSAPTARDATAELSPLVTWHYAAFACNPCGECESVGVRASVTPTLTQSLAAGGFVVFWRHATANTCSDRQSLGPAATTEFKDWWKSCDRNCATATARQLDPKGYEEADSIGSAIRAKKIPFSRVVSSEYCRATETASHLALGPNTETLPAITFWVYQTDPCGALPELLAQKPSSGTNTAIIAHTFVGCIDAIASAEAWVYRPDGAGKSTLVGKVKANEWSALP